MARRRRFAPTAGVPIEGTLEMPREHQITIFDRMEKLARRAEESDPRGPATALCFITLALLGFGLLIQASHAATTGSPELLMDELVSQAWFRLGGVALLLGMARLGPSGLRRFVPALTVLAGLMLIAVFVPPFGVERNGSNRWIGLFGRTFQPSELARVAIVLWIADRCVRLGPLVRDGRRGLGPMLALVLTFFTLILAETDLGGALLFLMCALATMWVGGARWLHVTAGATYPKAEQLLMLP